MNLKAANSAEREREGGGGREKKSNGLDGAVDIIGQWAGRFCVHISVLAPTQWVFKTQIGRHKATTPSFLSLPTETNSLT